LTKAIIFDFDGVILDSMPIRADGFREIFRGEDEKKIEQFMAYHADTGGVSRFVKIRYFYEELLGKSITEDEVQNLATEFSKIMKASLTDSKYLIMDCVNFIKKNHKNYRFHIASGAEEKELRFLCKEHELEQYFISIYGSPTIKKENIRKIIEENGYEKDTVLMIGDARTDYEASMENEIAFCGYNNPKLKELHPEYIESFRDLHLKMK